MSFILFRLAFAFMLLFTISLAALRARTVDEAELRALLLAPAACPAPCFMGVHPGETEGTAAMAIIAHHAWTVYEPIYIQPINDINIHYIMWQWSGAQTMAYFSQYNLPRWCSMRCQASLRWANDEN